LSRRNGLERSVNWPLKVIRFDVFERSIKNMLKLKIEFNIKLLKQSKCRQIRRQI